MSYRRKGSTSWEATQALWGGFEAQEGAGRRQEGAGRRRKARRKAQKGAGDYCSYGGGGAG